MGNQGMARMPRPILTLGLMVIFVVFLGVGVLSFSPAYGGPQTLGQRPDARSGVRAPGGHHPGVGEAPEEDTGQSDADVAEMATNGQAVPVMVGGFGVSGPEAAALRQKSGFDAFNAGYQNKWGATFSKETGKVRLLYGAKSRQYKNGPEAAARGFLTETSALFGLKSDLSDLLTEHVYRTPERHHVRLQQTYNSVPIAGAFVLVHATSRGQVTMVQNGYQPVFKPANSQVIADQAAVATAKSDLLASLGKEANLAEPKVEPLIIPYKDSYNYIWKVAVSTKKPIGYWVYHVDAGSGKILYKGNEILSLKSGKGRAYKTNDAWWYYKISSVSLKNMFTCAESLFCGYLTGIHADIYDYNFNDPYAPDYKFLYDDVTQEPWFDATDAYYQMQTVWAWWKKMYKKFNLVDPAFAPYGTHFLSDPIQVIVNGWDPTPYGLCNAYYDPGTLGFYFADENTCPWSNPDPVLDCDVVRHEYMHAMMDWFGVWDQFGDSQDRYGRAMGEGNADFGAYLNHPKEPCIGYVFNFPYCLRDLDNISMYPYTVDAADYPTPGDSQPEEHYTGEIWGGYLYDLYRVLKSKASWYVGNAYYYFDSTDGLWNGHPDFFDGINAQKLAEYDTTGKYTNTIKAWGSMASRGINFWLRPPYSNTVDYFYTGGPGNDIRPFNPVYFRFPPYKTIKTKGNTLWWHDDHEYPFVVDVSGLDLKVTLTAKAGGALNPKLRLYHYTGALLVDWVYPTPTAPNKCVLTYPNIPADSYVILVVSENTDNARGYYDISISVK